MKINLKARNDEHKMVLHTPSGAISIFNKRNPAPMGEIQRGVWHNKGISQSDKKDKDNELAVKADHDPKRMMDDSDEINKLRAICWQQTGNRYPPKEVTEQFEHLRPYLNVGRSESKNAGEGLITKGRRFIKDEIIGYMRGT